MGFAEQRAWFCRGLPFEGANESLGTRLGGCSQRRYAGLAQGEKKLAAIFTAREYSLHVGDVSSVLSCVYPARDLVFVGALDTEVLARPRVFVSAFTAAHRLRDIHGV